MTTEKREPLKFGKVEAIEFPNTMETALTTTLSLAQTINDLFRPIFVDYEGSSIQTDPTTGRFLVSLFFKYSLSNLILESRLNISSSKN